MSERIKKACPLYNNQKLPQYFADKIECDPKQCADCNQFDKAWSKLMGELRYPQGAQ